jgi:hypothetical protein
VPLSSALAALEPFAVPGERGRVSIPAGDGVVEPGDQVVLGLGMVALEGTADDDPLDRLGQVQPGAAERGVERQDAVLEQPADDRPAEVAGQVVPDQEESEGWQRLAWLMAEPSGPAGERRPLLLGEGDGRQRGEHRGQLLLQPGMEHRVGCVRDAFGPELAGGGTEQRHQFGGPAAHVLVGLTRRLAHRRPAGPGLRDRLVRPGLVLAPEPQAGRLG